MQHPTDRNMFLYWDIATDSPGAFWTSPAPNGSKWSWNEDFEGESV